MNTKELQKFFDLSLKPFGFKRKNSNWTIREPELTLIINLQRSSYSNFYYINYGYLINGLDFPLKMHVSDRLASTDNHNAKFVSELFDFEKPMDENLRMQEIKEILEQFLVPEILKIKTEDDLRTELKSRHHLFNISRIVTDYLKI